MDIKEEPPEEKKVKVAPKFGKSSAVTVEQIQDDKITEVTQSTYCLCFKQSCA